MGLSTGKEFPLVPKGLNVLDIIGDTPMNILTYAWSALCCIMIYACRKTDTTVFAMLAVSNNFDSVN